MTTEERRLWWFTTAAILLLLLGTVLLDAVLVAIVAGCLAIAGLVMLPSYRRHGAVSLLLAAAVAAILVGAFRLFR